MYISIKWFERIKYASVVGRRQHRQHTWKMTAIKRSSSYKLETKQMAPPLHFKFEYSDYQRYLVLQIIKTQLQYATHPFDTVCIVCLTGHITATWWTGVWNRNPATCCCQRVLTRMTWCLSNDVDLSRYRPYLVFSKTKQSEREVSVRRVTTYSHTSGAGIQWFFFLQIRFFLHLNSGVSITLLTKCAWKQGDANPASQAGAARHHSPSTWDRHLG